VQIDGFTLIAQIINFVILLFLLQHFLYDPIVEAMDKREARIKSRWEEAKEQRDKAEQEAKRYRQDRQELEEKRQEMLDEAQQAAQDRRQELLNEARQQVKEQQEHWQKALQRSQQEFLRELRHRVRRETDQVARRTLEELADAELEQSVVKKFAQRLRDIDQPARQALVNSIQQSDNTIIFRTAFQMPDQIRQQLTEVVQEHIMKGNPVDAHFEQSSDLICGIELQADGRRVSWSVDHYLETLEEQVRQKLEEETQQTKIGETGDEEK
jgi:F-type H+-transporting ATPase subunit b